MTNAYEPNAVNESAVESVGMLKAVIDGATYETVAAQFGVTRTAVERRIKLLAMGVSKGGNITGLNKEGATFVRRLRQHREAILAALAGFEAPAPFGPRATRVVSGEEIVQAALRIKGRSQRPWHDLSLFYMLFATAARPLEIARLEVRDYLDTSGDVRRESTLRATPRPQERAQGKSTRSSIWPASRSSTASPINSPSPDSCGSGSYDEHPG